MTKFKGLFVIIISITCLVKVPVRSQNFHFHEKTDGLLLKYDNQNIFFYQKQTKDLDGRYPRANYIHPLYGLNGEVLTEDFPDDHLHHRGIFWAWHQLYINQKKIGDPWACEGIEWKVTEVNHQSFLDSAQMRALVSWFGVVPGNPMTKPIELVREETIITCKNKTGDQLEIDFDIRLTALHEGTRLGGSEDNKGYGGFSIRIKLPDDISFYSIEGKIIPKETAIQAGGWMDIQGSFAQGEVNQTSLTIMNNPQNPSPFHGWILREKASMQNAAFPGRTPVSINKGETLRMQYKILLHRKNTPIEKIEKIYHQFIQG